MSRLQRSSVSFRRQGSSGRIWDDPPRSLDLKGLQAALPLPLPHVAAKYDDEPFSPRVSSEPSSARSVRGRAVPSAGVIAESPASSSSAGGPSPPPAAGSIVGHGVNGGGGAGAAARNERPARRRRRISSAFCACMGHPPASLAQQ